MKNSFTLNYDSTTHSSSQLTIAFSPIKMTEKGIIQKFATKTNTSTGIKILKKVGQYNLAWPIILSISYIDDLICVESKTPHLWGEGETLDKAIKSYENFFLYDLESYLDSPIEKLDYYAQQELALYKVLLNIA